MKPVFCLWLLLLPFFVFAQQRNSTTINFAGKAPKIDGILNDEIWRNTPIAATNFTQTVPSPDKPSLYKTEVKMVYTDLGIYIAATLFQPKELHLVQLTARDELNRVNADVFSVILDPYNDHQNGFAFKVSSAGVQQDERLFNGNENGDKTWDAVWTSKVSVLDDKWIVEMEIPYSAIRFPKTEEQVWGLNFFRSIRKLNESSYWSPINVRQQGFLIQNGILNGIKNIVPPTRLFLFPYVSTGYFERPEKVNTQKGILKSGGLDIKYGLNESFTLDVTLIPDFSQVVSDNIIRNLSPFEQQLTENRPFFTEGTELFNKANLFYSRRVGGRPTGYNTVENQYADTALFSIEKNPNITTLLNAVKFSGRNKNNVGIGIFNAIGSPMFAQVLDKTTNEKKKVQTEPLANYNVIVIDKPLQGQSFLNFTNTNVLKNGIAEDANVSSLQWTQFDKKEKHSISITTRMSIKNAQQFSVGTFAGIAFKKVLGKLQYAANAEVYSPKYDHSNLGILFDYNHTSQSFSINYTENKPKSPRLQLYRLALNQMLQENVKPFLFKSYQASASYFWLLKSFWDLTLEVESKPFRPTDFYQLRSFGKPLKQFPYLFTSLSGSSDSRKKLFWSFYSGYGFSNQPNTGYLYAEQGLRYLINNKIEISANGTVTLDNSNIGFAYYDNIINEPIVGRRNVKEYTGLLSLKYNFNPNVNLTARFRHYTNYIHYLSIHTVDLKGEWQNSSYPFNSNLDENFNLQNIDLFFNWMFKPGSRLVISYKQWLNDSYFLNDKKGNNYFQNVYQIIQKPQAFEVAVRLIYFLDYNELKNKIKK